MDPFRPNEKFNAPSFMTVNKELYTFIDFRNKIWYRFQALNYYSTNFKRVMFYETPCIASLQFLGIAIFC